MLSLFSSQVEHNTLSVKIKSLFMIGGEEIMTIYNFLNVRKYSFLSSNQTGWDFQ